MGRAATGPTPGTAAAEPPPAEPDSVARAICLRLLTQAPRTRFQLAAALDKRGVPREAADRVLMRFTEVGLVDDAAFAAAWVRSRQAVRGMARRALAHELRQRGVDEQVVDEALTAVDPEDEWATARGLVARKLPSTRGLDRPARMRRLAGLLERKGYPSGVALQVVREALAGELDCADSG